MYSFSCKLLLIKNRHVLLFPIVINESACNMFYDNVAHRLDIIGCSLLLKIIYFFMFLSSIINMYIHCKINSRYLTLFSNIQGIVIIIFFTVFLHYFSFNLVLFTSRYQIMQHLGLIDKMHCVVYRSFNGQIQSGIYFSSTFHAIWLKYAKYWQLLFQY